jgi:hypothetical protein
LFQVIRRRRERYETSHSLEQNSDDLEVGKNIHFPKDYAERTGYNACFVATDCTRSLWP